MIQTRKTLLVQRLHANFKDALATCLRSCHNRSNHNSSLEFITLGSHAIKNRDVLKDSLDTHFRKLLSTNNHATVIPSELIQLPGFTTGTPDPLRKEISKTELKGNHFAWQ